MGNQGRSEPNLFGGYTNYDSKGNKIGRSEPNLFGGYTNYDQNGRKIGRSDPTLFGGYNHYDNKGKKIGHSDVGLCGSYNHYDSKGNKTGHSDSGLGGGYSHSDGGCYVATCVYGSYDCPEVWTLRRFRDGILAKSMPGRLFIRAYYAISPRIVRMFGKQAWFHRIWKPFLDKRVKKLQDMGLESTPYWDLPW